MAVKDKDRDDYEAGKRDANHGVIRQAFDDITVNHPDSSAYYKGRDGEQFDGDKKDK